jgi:hypothetical protein
VSQFSIDQVLGYDADRLAARREHGVGNDAHEPDVSGAENQLDAAFRHGLSQLAGVLSIDRTEPDLRAAKNA